MLGMLQGEVAEQRVDRGQPVVAGGHAVVPVAFEVVQHAATSGASSSAMSRVPGALPVRWDVNPSSSRNVTL
ncbi:hypothetical protein GCM10009789_43800 [Kribbella sancticallisti]|uniref:Uncharacterized protein n=1 Tax=Kribbella sancticallisti TaxID=460087 RepID=A0ABP4PQF9_9ACTN